MIRINLQRSAGSAPAASSFRAWMGLLAIISAVLIAAVASWSVRADVARLEREAAAVEGELGALRTRAREAGELLARKDELTGRLSAIAKDSAARSAPVRVLAAVGASLPDHLWLTGIRQRESQFDIEGRAASLAAVTEFAKRIDVAGVLRTPVEIASTSAETRERSTFVRFSLRLD